MAFKTLSILIPVYNEKHTIEAILKEVLTAPLPDNLEKEIILVDDGSTDGTREILKKLEEKKIPQIKIFYNEKNMGKGATISRALSLSTGDICLIQDADLEYNPKEYPNLLMPILSGDADVVYGSRFVPSQYARVLYFWHYLGNRFLTFLSNCFTNLNLTDMETCYKVAIGPLFRSIPIRSKRFGMEPEITSKFAKRKFRIYEVPISYKGRTYLEGKKITWWDGIKTLFTIISFWFLNDSLKREFAKSKREFLEETPKYQIWLLKKIFPYIGERVFEFEPSLGNRLFFLLPKEKYSALTFYEDYFKDLNLRFGEKKGVSIFYAKDIARISEILKENGSYTTFLSLGKINFKIEELGDLLSEKIEEGGKLIIKGKNINIEKIKNYGFILEKTIRFDPLGNTLLAFHNLLLKEKDPCIFFRMLYERFLAVLKIFQIIPSPFSEKIYIFKKGKI
ncbi:MAG: glycosyltransferase family 2 protein [Thermoanaerobaculia bacterium]